MTDAVSAIHPASIERRLADAFRRIEELERRLGSPIHGYPNGTPMYPGYPSLPVWPTYPYLPTYNTMPICGCPIGSPCGSVSCPHAHRFTTASNQADAS